MDKNGMAAMPKANCPMNFRLELNKPELSSDLETK